MIDKIKSRQCDVKGIKSRQCDVKGCCNDIVVSIDKKPKHEWQQVFEDMPLILCDEHKLEIGVDL